MKFMGNVAVSALFLTALTSAQDRDRDRDRYWDNQNRRYTQLFPGTMITVRPTEAIDVERKDNRIYNAVVDQDVVGDNGRLAIPRGSTAELIVRVARDNDLILDLESITVNGQRYAVKTEPNRVQSMQDDSLVGALVGAISGGQAQGRTVRIPRDTRLSFRLGRPLDMGVADRGIMREGRHYHDYYDDRDRRDR